MNNKPKYHLVHNTKYAIDGLLYAIKTENSFRLELIAAVFILPMIYIIEVALVLKMVLFITAVFVLIVELINTAIENIVDLVTSEYQPLAKNAKDIGAAAVMVSIILHLSCWVIVLL